MLKQDLLRPDLQDVLYSLPYVLGKLFLWPLEPGFFKFADLYFRFKEPDNWVDKSTFDRIFDKHGFDGLDPERFVWNWIDVSWRLWEKYCARRHVRSGKKPERPAVSATPIEEIVF